MQEALNKRQSRLLVFLGGGNQKLDPIRIMKGMFLFDMKAPKTWLSADTRYNFSPYNYGPFTPELYRDLEHLQDLGYVRAEQALNRSWKHYSLTENGIEASRQAENSVGRASARYLHTLYDFVANVSFRQLLESVYEDFPDYAVNSVFK